MKYLYIIFFSFLLIACKAQNKTTIVKEQEEKTVTNCPDDGVCNVEIFLNSTLNIKTDTTNQIYAMVEKGEKLVFKFTYSKNVDKMYVDGHYIEEIYAEFENEISQLTLENKELQKVKLLFNRLCYCKGSTGFYRINNGKLTINKITDKTFSIQINFKIDEVPQVINSIQETLVLK